MTSADAMEIAPKQQAASIAQHNAMTSADAMEIAPTDGEGSAPEYAALPVYGEHKRAVSSVSFAPPTTQNNNGSSVSSNNAPPGGLATCASASADGTVKIWQVDTTIGRTDTAADMKSSTPLTARSHLQGHTRGINDVCWSPTGEYLATASDDKSLRLYDAIKGETFVEFKGHQNFVFCCKFNPQSNLLVSGSYDETVKLFDVRCGECVMTLPAHSDPVTGVDFSPDGTCICSGSYDGLIRVWDTATGECLKTIYAEGNPAVGNVSFAPNGRYVLGGTLDSKLRLWDVTGRVGVEGENVTNESGQRTGKCSKTYTGHMNNKFCVFSAFSIANRNRQSIVSGSEDGKVYIYDLQSRQIRQTLDSHSQAVLAIDAHRSLELIGSGGIDKTVRFWAPPVATSS